MKLIVAVDSKWGIGKNNDLLFHLKADMRHFVEHTKGKTVIMGSNTLRSFPNGMPLKGRTNIVLNPDGTESDAQEKGYILAKSLDGLFDKLHAIDTSDAYVIGGAMMYHTMLPYCEEAVITKVDADGDATVFLDDLDKLPDWQCTEISQPFDDNGYTIRFCTYKNSNPLSKIFA